MGTKVGCVAGGLLTLFKVKSIKFKELLPQREWGSAGVLFKKIVEIGRVVEAKAVGDIGYTPIGVFQERTGFVYNPG